MQTYKELIINKTLSYNDLEQNQDAKAFLAKQNVLSFVWGKN